MKTPALEKNDTDNDKIKNDVIDEMLFETWSLRNFRKSIITNGESTENYLIEKGEIASSIPHSGKKPFARAISQGETCYIFRNAGKYRDYVIFQIKLLDFLQKNRFPYATPIIIKTTNGGFFAPFEDNHYLLYRYIDGATIKPVDYSTHASAIGRCIGSFHRVTKRMSDYNPKIRDKDIFNFNYITKSISSSIARVKAQPKSDEIDELFVHIFSKGTEPYFDYINTDAIKYYEGAEKIPCHGDLKGENFLIKNGKMVGLIDFGGVIISPKIFDVQNCFQNIAGYFGKFDWDIVEKLISSYSEEIELTPQELSLIPSILVADILRTLAWIFESRAVPNNRINPRGAIFRLELLKNIKEIKSYFLSIK